MAEGAAMLNNASQASKPPLAMGVRLRLSLMMLLEFAVWGSWFTVFGNYLGKDGLGFDGEKIGNLYGTMALGAIISTLFAGQIADRFLSSEYIMAICHLGGAALLYGMAHIHSYTGLYLVSFAYALLYNPTLAVSNSIAFANIPDSTRDFPSLRVLGTIGWILAGTAVDVILPEGAKNTNKPLLMAAILSAVLGVFSFVLPHTPPTGKKGDAIPFLRAVKLLGDPSFGVFFGLSFVITIALAFYYGFAGRFLEDLHIKAVATTMTIGQWSELFFMLTLAFVLKKWGIKAVLGVGMAAWALRYGLFSLGHPFALIVIGVALHGVCFDFFLAAGFIYTDEKAPPAIRGSAQALFSFLVYGAGMWLGNVISGQVVNRFTVGNVTDWHKVWMIPSIGAAICLVFFLLVWRDRPGAAEPKAQGAAVA